MRKLPVITPRESIDIRGVYGQSVFELHEQIKRLLLQETRDRTVAQFFAEPQVNALRGEVTWYTDASGDIAPLASLDPVQRDQLLEAVERIRQRIKAVGEQFAGQGGATAGTRAGTFRAMLTTTDFERCLFSVGGDPVLCEWGCTAVADTDRSVDLWSMGPPRRSGDPAPTAAVEPRLPEKPVTPVAITAEHETPAQATVAPPAATPAEVSPPPLAPDPGQEEHRTMDPVATPAPVRISKPVAPQPAPTVRRTVPEPAAAHEYRDVSTAGVYRTGAVRPHPRWNWTGTGAWDWLWSLIKLAIVGLLALLVLGALVRACSSPPLVVGVGDQHEEQRLRAEIASLRAQIGQIARSCPASADRSAAGAGAMSLPARSNVTLAAMPSIAPPPCADRIRDDNA